MHSSSPDSNFDNSSRSGNIDTLVSVNLCPVIQFLFSLLFDSLINRRVCTLYRGYKDNHLVKEE